jgi:hypothetical protein
MTSQYRHRRSSDPTVAFPSTLEPGEIAVNTANRQIAVGDAASATLGTPEPLLGVRFFDARGKYAIGDYVINAGLQYCAKAANGPGAFTPANWNAVVMEGAASGTFVSKAGDTMSGALTVALSGAPTTGTYYFGNSGTKQLTYDGTNFTLAGGQLLVGSSGVWSGAGGATGLYLFGSSGTKYLSYDGTNYTLNGASTLTIVPGVAGPAILALNKSASGSGAQLQGMTGGLLRWSAVLGNNVAESGGNAGSDFVINRYNDAGVGIDVPLAIARATGIANFTQNPTVNGAAFAAPFDALAYNGMQINGGFTVSQEKGLGAGVTAFGSYICDGWMMTGAGTQVVSSSVLAGTAAMLAIGLTNCLAAAVTGSAPSLGATDSTTFLQRVEGYRVARLGWGFPSAQPITISFFTAHNRVGTYSVVARNSAATRSYATTYTQNVSDALEYKSVTIPGCTDGVWATDNTIGLLLQFAMACGTTQTAPSANSWLAGVYVAAPGQVNAVAANTDRFRLTDVVVLPGIDVPSAARAPLIIRPYDQELLTCKRYYEKTYPYANPPGTNGVGGSECRIIPSSSIVSGMFYGGVRFPVGKRATPTVTIYGYAGAVGQVSNMGGVDLGANTAVQYGQTENSFTLGSNAAATTTGNAINFHWVADARL